MLVELSKVEQRYDAVMARILELRRAHPSWARFAWVSSLVPGRATPFVIRVGPGLAMARLKLHHPS